MWEKWKNKFYRTLRLQRGAVFKIYTGYGNGKQFQIFAHLLSLSPIERKKFRGGVVRNTLALLRLFFVKPIPNAEVKIEFQQKTRTVITEEDGYIKLEWEEDTALQPGKYTCILSYQTKRGRTITAIGEIIVPIPASFACISDIDDTFLVSHSAHLRKRLFVLFTENAKSRKPFEGAVRHYRLLARLQQDASAHHTFFYVSSSEWNLHGYISNFIAEQKLPEGIMLLNHIKTFKSLLNTGQGSHEGKYVRIKKVLEQFPQQKFVLLGDDTQQDPFIYQRIVEEFPENIICVYLRRVGTPVKEKVLEVQKSIEEKAVNFFYFAHSKEAIEHSVDIGLIEREMVEILPE